MPTFIMVGEADIPDVHAHAGAIQAGIMGREDTPLRRIIPQAGHLVNLEQPELFNKFVHEFIQFGLVFE